MYWSVSNWIFDTINISWHCLIFYLSANIGNVSLFTRVRGIIWHITQMGNATTILYVKFRNTFSVRLTFLSVSDTVRSPYNCNGWTPHLLRNVCSQRRSEQECPLTRIFYCSLLFRVVLNFEHNARTCSLKTILWMKVLKIVILIILLYCPLYYSGMELSFALKRLILFCNSIVIQMKFKRKTFFSKFYFSNLVICWCKKVLKLHSLKTDI